MFNKFWHIKSSLSINICNSGYILNIGVISSYFASVCDILDEKTKLYEKNEKKRTSFPFCQWYENVGRLQSLKSLKRPLDFGKTSNILKGYSWSIISSICNSIVKFFHFLIQHFILLIINQIVNQQSDFLYPFFQNMAQNILVPHHFIWIPLIDHQILCPNIWNLFNYSISIIEYKTISVSGHEIPSCKPIITQTISSLIQKYQTF